MAASSKTTDEEAVKEFGELVNMSPAALEKWLHTGESKEVGWSKDGDGESVGHESGRHIIRILQKKKSEFTQADIAHMHKVVGYIKRHSAQWPGGDVSETRWAYSLKNWGHDPTKK